MKYRYELINWLIKRFAYKTYLEIGTQKGVCLAAVQCKEKIGVDPNPLCGVDSTQIFAVTSDEFFNPSPSPEKRNDTAIYDRLTRIKDEKFDIVFVDGLHLAEQAERDIINSFERLNPGGCVLVHDCAPRNEQEQVRERGNLKAWTGDVWRGYLRARAIKDVWSCTVNIETGVGVMFKSKEPNGSKITEPKTYREFSKDRIRLLNLVQPDEFVKMLTK